MKIILVILTIMCSILSATEIANYKLDNNANNSINSNFNGTIIGNVLSTIDRNNKENSALLFKGGYITIPNFKSFNFGNELTISLWMRRDSIPNYQGIISNGYYKSSSFEIRMGRESEGTVIRTRANGSFGTVGTSSSYVINIGKWHHIGYVISAYEVKFYIDGILVSNNLKSQGNLNIKNNSLIIGANGALWEKFNGALDNIRIFNNALTYSEITALYNGTFDKFKLEVKNEKNITTIDEGKIPIKIKISNLSDTKTKFFHWSTLTLPSKKVMSLTLPKRIKVNSKKRKIIKRKIMIKSWYENGEYIYTYYFMNKQNQILTDSFTFRKE